MLARRPYGVGVKLAILVSLCFNYAPTIQAKIRVHGGVGSGRDYLLTSVDYLGAVSAVTPGGCCLACSKEFPASQFFSSDDLLGLCSCMKTKQGVVPQTTESVRSYAGMCENSHRGRGRRRRGGRRGRGRRQGGSDSPDEVSASQDQVSASLSRSQTAVKEDLTCLDLVSCVQCQQFESGELMDGGDDVFDQQGVAECDKCQFESVGVELSQQGWNDFPSLANQPVCGPFMDDDLCTFTFVYWYQNGLPKVWVQKNKMC